MSLLSVVNEVCAMVGVHSTTAIFANISAYRTMQEMLALANEMAQRIATDTREWTVLRKSAVIPGDGASEAFNLPPDFRRMLMSSNVWLSTSTQHPAYFVTDTDSWMQRRAANWTDGFGEWTIFGGQIHIHPVMGVGISARFSYLDKNCIERRDTAGAFVGLAEQFQTDDDTFRLPERLLKLGMLWQWKALKGSPYAEDMGTWSDAMAIAMGTDSPSPILIDRMPPSMWGPNAVQ
jgi:hypothetical protein